MVIINLILVFVCWHWANVAFENDARWTGWFNIFCSAMNAAAAMVLIFR